MSSDEEAIDYFLRVLLANIKLEYKSSSLKMSEDEYIIHKLHAIAGKIVKDTSHVV